MKEEITFLEDTPAPGFSIIEGGDASELFKNYLRYKVSSLGRIYSIRSKKFLKPYATNYGHLEVTLGSKQRSVAAVVLELFRGPGNGKRAFFYDGDVKNVELNNLDWR